MNANGTGGSISTGNYEHKDKIDEFFLASAKMIENLAKKLFSKNAEKKKE